MSSTQDAQSCLTCGWGVCWYSDLLDEEHISGRCQWQCPVPHPDQFGHQWLYSTESKPETDCPAWKPAADPESMQRWAEHPRDYHARLMARANALADAYERSVSMASQCLRCAHEPAWTVKDGKDRRLAWREGVCGISKKMSCMRDTVVVEKEEGEFFIFTEPCPSWQAKEPV